MADNPKTNPMNDEDPKSRKDRDIPDRQKVTRKVATVGVGGNIFLAAFKLFAGIFGNSTAMISDASPLAFRTCSRPLPHLWV